MRVLVVEDDPATRETLARALGEESIQVDAVGTAASAEDLAQGHVFDAIVLDVVLPDLDGVSLCRRLRELGVHTPILLLTGRHAVDDRVRGLDSGADDFLAKPFEIRELLARIRALTRRGRIARTGAPLAYGPIELHPHDRVVRLNGAIVELTTTEFRLLEYLMRRPKDIVSREELAWNVWGDSIDQHSNVIDVYIGYLRKKLSTEAFPILRTIRGAGFTLDKGGN